MLRGINKLLTAIAVAVPLVTFGTASGPAGAIPPSKPICFGVSGGKGDVGIVNLTPVLATAAGDGQLVPLDLFKNPPVAANVNFGPGTIDPNVAFSRLGVAGSVCFENSKHANVELIADHLGTIRGRFYQFAQNNGAPKRVMDTRKGTIIGPKQNRCFKVAGRPGDAAVVNLTPVAATGGGDGQLISSDIKNKPPVAANVNFAPGSVDPNVAIARIGKNNQVCFVNSKHASVHVIADHLGTIKANAYSPAQKNGAPKRVIDTRGGNKVPPNGSRCFKVSGRPGDAAVVNLTPVAATGPGDAQLVSSNVRNNPPIAANVNYRPGAVDPNVAIAKIGDDNKVCFVNSKHGSVHFIADHLGTINAKAYTSARRNGAPKRVVDTRDGAEITPVSARGARPVRPSQVFLACGYDAGILDYSSRRVTFGGLDGNKNEVRLTFYNDILPNSGKDRVIDLTIPAGYDGTSYVYTLYSNGELPYKTYWNGRIGIETYRNNPNLNSMAIFEVSDLCAQNTRLKPNVDELNAGPTMNGPTTWNVAEEFEL